MKVPASAHHILKIIVDKLHVSTPDADVTALIMERLTKAARKSKNPMPDKATCDMYCREALKIHHANRALFNKVMRG